MEITLQEHLDQFASDFAAVANALQPDEVPTLDLVRTAIIRLSHQNDSASADRCQRILNAYSYVEKNGAAFRQFDSIVHFGEGLKIEGALIVVLYLFFMSTDRYLTADPALDVFIDELLKAHGS